MTHEFKKIFDAYRQAKRAGTPCVLATVVALEGSSYRRPGVRMLLTQDGRMVGAVSGGCVEKEVSRQATTVFKTGAPKVMDYDGRYRLGCEGLLFILLEPFELDDEAVAQLEQIFKNRLSFTIKSFFDKAHKEEVGYGSILFSEGREFKFHTNALCDTSKKVFAQQLQPCFQMVVIGAEHDAVQLCSLAAMTGWQVTVIAPLEEEKRIEDFPGAQVMVYSDGEELPVSLDDQTAVVLMTHSFVKDLKFLKSLSDSKSAYFGILGPADRREKLFDQLVALHPEVSPDFLEGVYGPAGLDLGAETPQEIAVSIIGEIIAVLNGKPMRSLREKKGRIHA